MHTGIDLIQISRIENLLKENSDGFLRRIATDQEITAIKNHQRAAEKAAACFALKEAFSKAVGTGLGADLAFQDLEVTYLPSGRPQIQYVGRHYKKASSWQVSCSVSHDGGFLIAMVVIQGELQ